MPKMGVEYRKGTAVLEAEEKYENDVAPLQDMLQLIVVLLALFIAVLGHELKDQGSPSEKPVSISSGQQLPPIEQFVGENISEKGGIRKKQNLSVGRKPSLGFRK